LSGWAFKGLFPRLLRFFRLWRFLRWARSWETSNYSRKTAI